MNSSVKAIEKSEKYMSFNEAKKADLAVLETLFVSKATKSVAALLAKEMISINHLPKADQLDSFAQQHLKSIASAAQGVVDLTRDDIQRDSITQLIESFHGLAQMIQSDASPSKTIIDPMDARKVGRYLKSLYLDGKLTSEQKICFAESYPLRLVMSHAEPGWRQPAWNNWSADLKSTEPWTQQRADTMALECALKEHKNLLSDPSNSDFIRFKNKGWVFLEHRVGDARVIFATKGASLTSREKNISQPQLWAVAKIYRNPSTVSR